jgi:anti-sigma factor RsiW
MECPEVARRLWEYLDGELAAKEAGAVEGHLVRCPSCGTRVRCARAFLACLSRGLSRPCPVPDHLRVALRVRLDVEDPPR